jgi:hypothetical protein
MFFLLLLQVTPHCAILLLLEKLLLQDIFLIMVLIH